MFPLVDDGSIRPEILKFIKNNDFTIDLKSCVLMEDFQTLFPDEKFVKIADCLLNTPENFPSNRAREYLIEEPSFDGKLIDYQPVDSIKSKWSIKNTEWVYTILYDGRILKIGMTCAGLSSRFDSYNTGKKRAMIKGTPATTNYMISQCNYLAIRKGIKVEIYGYEIPRVTDKRIICGVEREVVYRIAHDYEGVLIELYRQQTGNIPFLCGQYGK